MHLISDVCVAYYEFPGGTAFQMKTSADVLTSHHSHTSSVHTSQVLWPHHAYVLIHPWTTAKVSGPVWPPYQTTGTTDQTNLAKLHSAQLKLMSLHSKLVWQLSIIEHKINRHGDNSLKWQHPLDKTYDYDDDDNLSAEELTA